MNTGDIIPLPLAALHVKLERPKQNARDTLNCWNFAKRETLSFAATGLARKKSFKDAPLKNT